MNSLMLTLLASCAIGAIIISDVLPNADAFSIINKGLGHYFHRKLSHIIQAFLPKKDTNIKYLYFSRNNSKEPCSLQPTKEDIEECNFNPTKPTKILIHGWISNFTEEHLVFVVKDKILEVCDCNVVLMDWTEYIKKGKLLIFGYVYSSALSFYVGLELAVWIHCLQKYTNYDPKHIHLITHSLGVIVGSVAGKATCDLRRITHLDPAGPIVRCLPKWLRPSEKDAHFVEAMHTSASRIVLFGLGLKFPIGNIDYYPNGGEKQPKCSEGRKFHTASGEKQKVNSYVKDLSCDHNAPFNYYIASFNKSCRFIGRICDSYENFLSGKCQNGQKCEMSYYSKKRQGLKPGCKCFFQTSGEFPYCLGLAGSK